MGAAPATGRKRFAPKTSNGSRERTPQYRRRISRIFDGREIGGMHMTNGKFPRRKFLHLAACAAALPVVSWTASAQTYPMRPLRWIVGYPPGGAADTLA